MFYIKKFLALLLLSACALCAAFSAYANSGAKSVVRDSKGGIVRSISSSECARTRWDSGEDECGGVNTTHALNNVPFSYKPDYETTTHDRSYIIFFDFSESVLSLEAKNILDKLVVELDHIDLATFKLVGHTDRSGSDQFNETLSRLRSESVKRYLTELGARNENIVVHWKGESEPLVPTNDGIKEAQNRRTEIYVKEKRITPQ